MNPGFEKIKGKVQSAVILVTEMDTEKGDYIPLYGESIYVVIPPELTPGGITITLNKMGNGINSIKELPYISSLASDVSPWAKQPTKPAYKLSELIAEDGGDTTPLERIEAIESFIRNTNFVLVESEIEPILPSPLGLTPIERIENIENFINNTQFVVYEEKEEE